jgi:hypothetical protein
MNFQARHSHLPAALAPGQGSRLPASLLLRLLP